MSLRLRPPTVADADVVRVAQAECADDDFVFALADYDPEEPFADWVHRCRRYRRGLDLPGRLVPATFLLAEVDGEVVGRSSVRFELNDFLAREGGHIGYGVRPAFRRRGHATEILRQSLVIARAEGIGAALVFCDDSNVGSATIIERQGGVFDGYVEPAAGGERMRRYWIP